VAVNPKDGECLYRDLRVWKEEEEEEEEEPHKFYPKSLILSTVAGILRPR
jgi:hypothetical protein